MQRKIQSSKVATIFGPGVHHPCVVTNFPNKLDVIRLRTTVTTVDKTDDEQHVVIIGASSFRDGYARADIEVWLDEEGIADFIVHLQYLQKQIGEANGR